jgi:addiction module RelB/DinJ family antitoxin
MSLITRTATIQVRVVPVVKRASEEVLWRIGLTMSQAIELFLRRVIVDERIPFDLIALETAQIDMVPESSLTGERTTVGEENGARVGRLRSKSNPRAARKKFKKFLGAHASGKIRAPKGRKNSA